MTKIEKLTRDFEALKHVENLIKEADFKGSAVEMVMGATVVIRDIAASVRARLAEEANKEAEKHE